MIETSQGRVAAPYPPSWIDQLMGWVDRLPGPWWVAYVCLVVAFAVANLAVHWVDGSLPVGTVDPARVADAPLVLYFLALMHYLNGTARRSLRAFRPALASSDADVERLGYELTHLSRGVGLVILGVGLVGGVLSVVSGPQSWGLSEESSWSAVAYTVIASIVSLAFAFAFLVHTIRQLRLVSRIHRQASRINLFERVPVYAFSSLTVRTGIGIVLVMYYYVYTFFVIGLFGPGYAPSAIDLSFVVAFVLVAAASFVLPLNGMHHRLATEKTRLLAEADRRFELVLDRLHQRVDADSLDDSDGLNKTLASLVIERDALAKISTWPWRPETLRGFLTSVALPVLIYVFTTILGRFLRA